MRFSVYGVYTLEISMSIFSDFSYGFCTLGKIMSIFGSFSYISLGNYFNIGIHFSSV